MVAHATWARFSITTAVVLGAGVLAQSQVQQEFQTLVSTDSFGDFFGVAVGISGDTAVIGAYDHDGFGLNAGAAYLFDITTGQQTHKLVPVDIASGDRFGRGVAITGNRAIVGSFFDDDLGNASGSAYVFDTSSGQQVHKLLPTDGKQSQTFGTLIAASGNHALIGSANDDALGLGFASGSAYLFDIVTGQQLHKLIPNDGADGDLFGFFVATSETTSVVGAPFDDDLGEDSGSAYVFDNTLGQQTRKLLPLDGAAGDHFGSAVAVSGNIALIGAYGDDEHGRKTGAAYAFDHTTGRQLYKLTPTNISPHLAFGFSVAIASDFAVVGATNAHVGGMYSGAAYVFDLRTGQQVSQLAASDGRRWSSLGYSMSTDGNRVLIGSRQSQAYVFDTKHNSSRTARAAGAPEASPQSCHCPDWPRRAVRSRSRSPTRSEAAQPSSAWAWVKQLSTSAMDAR